MPEPLASVVDYLGEEIEERQFIPTGELVTALDVDPGTFAQQMRELGWEPTGDRVPTEEGTLRQVRGYRTADIRAAVRDWSARGDERGRCGDQVGRHNRANRVSHRDGRPVPPSRPL